MCYVLNPVLYSIYSRSYPSFIVSVMKVIKSSFFVPPIQIEYVDLIHSQRKRRPPSIVYFLFFPSFFLFSPLFFYFFFFLFIFFLFFSFSFFFFIFFNIFWLISGTKRAEWADFQIHLHVSGFKFLTATARHLKHPAILVSSEDVAYR